MQQKNCVNCTFAQKLGEIRKCFTNLLVIQAWRLHCAMLVGRAYAGVAPVPAPLTARVAGCTKTAALHRHGADRALRGGHAIPAPSAALGTPLACVLLA